MTPEQNERNASLNHVPVLQSQEDQYSTVGATASSTVPRPIRQRGDRRVNSDPTGNGSGIKSLSGLEKWSLPSYARHSKKERQRRALQQRVSAASKSLDHAKRNLEKHETLARKDQRREKERLVGIEENPGPKQKLNITRPKNKEPISEAIRDDTTAFSQQDPNVGRDFKVPEVEEGGRYFGALTFKGTYKPKTGTKYKVAYCTSCGKLMYYDQKKGRYFHESPKEKVVSPIPIRPVSTQLLGDARPSEEVPARSGSVPLSADAKEEQPSAPVLPVRRSKTPVPARDEPGKAPEASDVGAHDAASSSGTNQKPASQNRISTEVTCSACGDRCSVPFVPNGKKPVYCSKCYKNKGVDPAVSETAKLPRSDGSIVINIGSGASAPNPPPTPVKEPDFVLRGRVLTEAESRRMLQLSLPRPYRWLGNSLDNYFIRSKVVSHHEETINYEGERRLISARGVKEYKQPFEVRTAATSFHVSSRAKILVALLACVVAMSLNVVIGHIVLSGHSYAAITVGWGITLASLGLLGSFLGYVYRLPDRIVVSCSYVPHLLSNIILEYERGTPAEVAAKSLRQKVRRLAAFPLPDQSADLYIESTEVAAMVVLESTTLSTSPYGRWIPYF